MVSLQSSDKQSRLPNNRSRPPMPLNPETLLSPHQMANRLRTRLRRARTAIERDLGHSLTSIVSLPTSPPTFDHRQQLLGSRAHSYSHGDFPVLLDANGGSGAQSTALQRHHSAAPHLTAHSGAHQPTQHPLDLSSSPPMAPSTPQLHPHDTENEVARTILMLATPPAARASSLSESPCQRPARNDALSARPRRRLSFSRHHSDDRPGGRASPYARPSVSPRTAFATPNLSQIAALTLPSAAAARRKRLTLSDTGRPQLQKR
ncbi:hypothetical protein GGH19_002239 [Coemansia sp. RSA 1807]|nr:hypothetical protein GGH17_000964 [Coemansia sp. RSA 788]KAJ2148023.1 hypothetical protein IW142_001253 [Coemansia sp. RSA 564]KAJ2166163.1 hypothetical protein GGH15_002922 [Coemansia sp. RSA 562]KAJ2190194.1 hypothetical protein EV181_001174 [Coemansia sp. RSA 532]KAJ2196555.1 hypothetical protein IW144_002868 [Coemansia sp. RSA 522]KAJ2231014.1 hypothetical protein EV180_000628 [Coemansia sp. RSA 518]KAJ2267935.1 hypothetical protein EV176_005102 [Coemansia sp. RSA 451]KAJ2274022.1 hyp